MTLFTTFVAGSIVLMAVILHRGGGFATAIVGLARVFI